MVDIVTAAVAAHVCDTPFVVVAGGHAGVAVEAGVVLTSLHEGLKVWVLASGRWRHAIIGVGVVGCQSRMWAGGLDELRWGR